jgi:hypothetical protein
MRITKSFVLLASAVSSRFFSGLQRHQSAASVFCPGISDTAQDPLAKMVHRTYARRDSIRYTVSALSSLRSFLPAMLCCGYINPSYFSSQFWRDIAGKGDQARCNSFSPDSLK